MPPRPRLTHFLCLPLVNASSREQLQGSLDRLRNNISSKSKEEDREVLLKSIRPVGTLHLTLGVMSLLDQDRIESAVGFLQDFDFRPLLSAASSSTGAESQAGAEKQAARASAGSCQPLPLSVSLTHLLTMKEPTNTSVLYAPPIDPTSRLQPFCEAVQERFVSAGFLVPEERVLTLHATILNTIYAAAGSARIRGARNRGRGGPLRFNASRLIEEFQDVVWAEDVRLDRIALCEMGAKKVLDDKGNAIDEAYDEVTSQDILAGAVEAYDS